ncbi:uncharacterized protein LOC142319306 [Lycorma delicatula]|uniref:uncharacterized protein LOC142319306 n=1 Tax=Lycorma delicatula TaxID=130591 RepID=UPI003F51A54D
MDLSKPLQEDIRKNQLNLKVAIKNHQALVLKLRGNFDDPTEIKHQLADIQKHIISLGEAQKVLVARVKKEIAAKSWNNNNNNNNNSNNNINNNGIEDDTFSSSQLSFNAHPALSLQSSTAKGKIKTGVSLISEHEQRGKRKREDNDYDEEDDNDEDDDDDEDEEIASLSPSSKRIKPMLSVRRPSTPTSAHDYQPNDQLASSSDDSQESVACQEPPTDGVHKEQFMLLLNLITKDALTQLQSKNRERRRRRLAGRHSLYTSHWDLTVQRRSRTRLERDVERQQEYEREDSPIGSPPIIEVKKDNDSSSDSTSPSPPPLSKSRDDSGSYKNVCIICRKQGILSICDNCSATYHWSCLDKVKICPQCQVGQIGPESHNNSRSGSPSPNPSVDNVSKVLGDTSKPPTHVSSMEVFARYFNRNTNASEENTFAERLKVKKMLEARKHNLKMDLATLEEKAAQLSASLVNQTANIKELSAGEEKIRERIKRVVDFISSMKKTENVPS